MECTGLQAACIGLRATHGGMYRVGCTGQHLFCHQAGGLLPGLGGLGRAVEGVTRPLGGGPSSALGGGTALVPADAGAGAITGTGAGAGVGASVLADGAMPPGEPGDEYRFQG